MVLPDAGQLAIVDVTAKVSASIGLLGVLGMVLMFVLKPQEFRTPMGRLILALSGADFIDSSAKFISRWGPTDNHAKPPSDLCLAQFSLILEGDVSTVILVGVISLKVVILTTSKKYYAISKAQEAFVIAIAFLFPVPFWMYTVFSPTWFGGNSIIGDSNSWCYISSSNFWPYSFFFYYIFQWSVFIFNIFAIFMTWYKLKDMARAVSIATNNSNNSKRIMFVVERMIAFLVAFFVGHIFSNINRISGAITNVDSFILVELQAAVSPARGMLNFLAFIYSYYTSPARRFSGTGSGGNSSTYQMSGNHRESNLTILKNESNPSVYHSGRDLGATKETPYSY